MTARIEKSVFISYRRTNLPWALAIYQDLTAHGFDVFFDYQSIDSGNFEKIITENIKARAHFILLLSPSSLERCKEPDDWLRREIETAMDEKRNIVPLMLEGFDFGSPATKEALTGKLASLKYYNGLFVYSEYFFESMERLRKRYLEISFDELHHPPSTLDENIATAVTDESRDILGSNITINIINARDISSLSQGTTRPLRVFLCHASQDKPMVRELYKFLKDDKIEAWFDEENILPGQDWNLEIEKAVKAADAVIVCLSNVSVNKEGYVQKEIQSVLELSREKPKGTIYIIPLRLDDCEVPEYLLLWQYIDFFPDDRKDWAYQRLQSSLRQRALSLQLL